MSFYSETDRLRPSSFVFNKTNLYFKKVIIVNKEARLNSLPQREHSNFTFKFAMYLAIISNQDKTIMMWSEVA